MPSPSQQRDTDPALRATGLQRSFGSVTALDGVSFEVRRGELYGLVGPDGAGKTTTVRALTGLLLVDQGRCEVFGLPPTEASVRERLGLMPQQYSLYRDLSVRENLRFFARLNALPRKVYEQRAERLLAITRLAPFLERRADALSGGMYKKLALACALLHEPEVLLLDEPTNGVDPVSRRELWELLHEFVQGGMAVLISTPYMDEAERCHRVGLLYRGRLLLEGEPPRLLHEFEGETYRIEGRDRDEIERILRALPCVHAMSPVGSRLRVVIERHSADMLHSALVDQAPTLTEVSPSFEDVYLARLHHAEQNPQATSSAHLARSSSPREEPSS